MAEILQSIENVTEVAGEWLKSVGSKVVELLPHIVIGATLIGVVKRLFEGEPGKALGVGVVGVAAAAGANALS